MKRKADGFRLALGVIALGMIWLANSVSALSQDAAPKPPDGSQAQSILQLVPRHATLSVADLKAETNWYVEKLGFSLPSTPQMGPGGPGGKMQGVELTIPGFQMHLIQFDGSQRAKTPTPEFLAQGWVHIAFSVADPDKAYYFLKAAGVDVKGNLGKNGKMGTLVLHDPEGNAIELFSR